MARAFRVGARVDGLYDANADDVWYPARVRSVAVSEADGLPRYELLYDDGEVEAEVPPACIRAHAAGNLSVGTRVVARYAGGEELYAGKIAEVQDDGRYTIEYDDSEVETDVPLEYVSESPEDEEQEETGTDDKDAVEADEHQSQADSTQAVDEPEHGHHQEFDGAESNRQEAAREHATTSAAPINDDSLRTGQQHHIDQPTTATQQTADREDEPSSPPAKRIAFEASAAPPHITPSSSSSTNPSAVASIESLELLHTRLGDASSAKAGLSALVKQMRAFPQDTAALVHSHNGETLLLEVLTTHRSHAVVQCYAFVLLRRLCFLSATSTRELLANDRGEGVVARIVGSMRSFSDDAILQAAACGALAVFTREQAGLASLLDQRAAMAVLASLRGHRTYSVHTRQVHYYGSEVLLELCELGDRDTMAALCADEMPAEASDDASPIELLLFLLRQALSFDDKKACCAVGSLIMCLAASERSAAARVLRLNGLPELSTVMAKFATEPGIQKFAAAASKAIALSSIQSTAAHAHKQPAPSKKVRERAAEILMESGSLESLHQEGHRAKVSLGGSNVPRHSGKSVNGASSSSAGSVRKRKVNAPAFGVSPRSANGGAAANDPLSFSKFASPIGRAPQYSAFNGSHLGVSTSREQLQQQQVGQPEQSQPRANNSNLVILDTREEKQSQLFDTYGIPAAARPRNSLGGVKRTHLKTHVVSAENAWATRVSGQQLMRDDMLTGPAQLAGTHRTATSRSERISPSETETAEMMHSPVRQVDHNQSAFDQAYANYSAAMGHSADVEGGPSPAKHKRKKKSTGAGSNYTGGASSSRMGGTTALKVRIENEAQTLRAKALRSPFASPLSPSKKDRSKPKRSKHGAATPKNSRVHGGMFSPAGADSMNAYATQLFQNNGSATPVSNNKSSARSGADRHERERLSFADKLHKMIDKAKSTLASSNVTAMPIEVSPTVASPKSSSRSDRPAAPSSKTRVQSSRQPLAAPTLPSVAAPAPALVSKKKPDASGSASSVRKPKTSASASSSAKPATPGTSHQAAASKHLSNSQASSHSTQKGKGESTTRSLKPTSAPIPNEVIDPIESVSEPTDQVAQVPTDDSEPASRNEASARAVASDETVAAQTTSLAPDVVEPESHVVDSSVSDEKDSTEKAGVQGDKPAIEIGSAPVKIPDQALPDALALEEDNQDVADSAPMPLSVPGIETDVVDADFTGEQVSEESPMTEDQGEGEPLREPVSGPGEALDDELVGANSANSEALEAAEAAQGCESEDAVFTPTELSDQPAPANDTSTEEQPSEPTAIRSDDTRDQEDTETPEGQSTLRAATPMDDIYADAESEFDDDADDAPETTEAEASDHERSGATMIADMPDEVTPRDPDSGIAEPDVVALPNSKSGDQLYGDDEYDEFEDEDPNAVGDEALPSDVDLRPAEEASSSALVPPPDLDPDLGLPLVEVAETVSLGTDGEVGAPLNDSVAVEKAEPGSIGKEVTALDNAGDPVDAGTKEAADVTSNASIAAEEDTFAADQVGDPATENQSSGNLESPRASEEDASAFDVGVNSKTSDSHLYDEITSPIAEEQSNLPEIPSDGTVLATSIDPSAIQEEKLVDSGLLTSRPATAAYGDDDFDEEDTGDCAESPDMVQTSDTGSEEACCHETESGPSVDADIVLPPSAEDIERDQPPTSSFEESVLVVAESGEHDSEPVMLEYASIMPVELSVGQPPEVDAPAAAKSTPPVEDNASNEDASGSEHDKPDMRVDLEPSEDVDDAYGDGEFDDDGTQAEEMIAKEESEVPAVDDTSDDRPDVALPQVGDATDEAAAKREIEISAVVESTPDAPDDVESGVVAADDPVASDSPTFVGAARPENEDHADEVAAPEATQSIDDANPSDAVEDSTGVGVSPDAPLPATEDRVEVTGVMDPASAESEVASNATQPPETARSAVAVDDSTLVDEPQLGVDGSVEEAEGTQPNATDSDEAVDDAEESTPAAATDEMTANELDPSLGATEAESRDTPSDTGEATDVEASDLETNHRSIDDSASSCIAGSAAPPVEVGEATIDGRGEECTATSTPIEPDAAIEAEIDAIHKNDTESADACIEAREVSRDLEEAAASEEAEKQHIRAENILPESIDDGIVDVLESVNDSGDEPEVVATGCSDDTLKADTLETAQDDEPADATPSDETENEFEALNTTSDESITPVQADKGRPAAEESAQVSIPDEEAAPDTINAVADAADTRVDPVEDGGSENAMASSKDSEQPIVASLDGSSEPASKESAVVIEPALQPKISDSEPTVDSSYTAMYEEDRADDGPSSPREDTGAAVQVAEEAVDATPRAEAEMVPEIVSADVAGEEYVEDQYADDGFGDDEAIEQSPLDEPESLKNPPSELAPSAILPEEEAKTSSRSDLADRYEDEEDFDDDVKAEDNTSADDRTGEELDAATAVTEVLPEEILPPEPGLAVGEKDDKVPSDEAAADPVIESGGDGNAQSDSNAYVESVEDADCTDDNVPPALIPKPVDQTIDELEQPSPAENDSYVSANGSPDSTESLGEPADHIEPNNSIGKEQHAGIGISSPPVAETEPLQLEEGDPSNTVSDETGHNELEGSSANVPSAVPVTEDSSNEAASDEAIENDSVVAPEDPPSSVSKAVSDTHSDDLDAPGGGDHSEPSGELLLHQSESRPDPPALVDDAAQSDGSQAADTDKLIAEQPLEDATVNAPLLESLSSGPEEDAGQDKYREAVEEEVPPVSGPFVSDSNSESSTADSDHAAESEGDVLFAADVVGGQIENDNEVPAAEKETPADVSVVKQLEEQNGYTQEEEDDSISTEGGRDPDRTLQSPLPSAGDYNAEDPPSADSEAMQAGTTDASPSEAPNEAELLDDGAQTTIPVEEVSPDESPANGRQETSSDPAPNVDEDEAAGEFSEPTEDEAGPPATVEDRNAVENPIDNAGAENESTIQLIDQAADGENTDPATSIDPNPVSSENDASTSAEDALGDTLDEQEAEMTTAPENLAVDATFPSEDALQLIATESADVDAPAEVNGPSSAADIASLDGKAGVGQQPLNGSNENISSEVPDLPVDGIATDSPTLGQVDGASLDELVGSPESVAGEAVSLVTESEGVASPIDEDGYAEEEAMFGKEETEPAPAASNSEMPGLRKGDSESTLDDAYEDEPNEFDDEEAAPSPSSLEKEDSGATTDAVATDTAATSELDAVVDAAGAIAAPGSPDTEYDEFENEEDEAAPPGSDVEEDAPVPAPPASTSEKAQAEEPDEYADDAEYDGFEDDEPPPPSQQVDSTPPSIPSSSESTPREENEPSPVVPALSAAAAAPEEVEEDYAADDDYGAEEDFEEEDKKPAAAPAAPASPATEEENEYEAEYEFEE